MPERQEPTHPTDGPPLPPVRYIAPARCIDHWVMPPGDVSRHPEWTAFVKEARRTKGMTAAGALVAAELRRLHESPLPIYLGYREIARRISQWYAPIHWETVGEVIRQQLAPLGLVRIRHCSIDSPDGEGGRLQTSNLIELTLPAKLGECRKRKRVRPPTIEQEPTWPLLQGSYLPPSQTVMWPPRRPAFVAGGRQELIVSTAYILPQQGFLVREDSIKLESTVRIGPVHSGDNWVVGTK